MDGDSYICNMCKHYDECYVDGPGYCKFCDPYSCGDCVHYLDECVHDGVSKDEEPCEGFEKKED